MRKKIKNQAKKLLGYAPEFVRDFASKHQTRRILKSSKNSFSNESICNVRSMNYGKKVQEYWQKHAKTDINPAWHFMFANFCGKEDPRFIPQGIWGSQIHFILNEPIFLFPTFADKNFMDFLFDKKHLPKTVFKVVKGRYYDNHHNPISKEDAFARLLVDDKDKIVKPSMSSSADRVTKVAVQDSSAFVNSQRINIGDLENVMGENFLAQYCIEQHDLLGKAHPNSLNTLRISTVRLHNEIHELIAINKIGKENGITDYMSYVRGIETDGTMTKVAYERSLTAYEKHPDTGFRFNEVKKVPSYREAVNLCKKLHKKVLHLDFAAWDVAIKKDGTPCILEVNSNPSVWYYQFVCKKPFFGDLTEDILKVVTERKEHQRPKTSIFY